MGILARYIFKEWLSAFALTIAVVLGLLILQNMYDALPDLLDYGASFEMIVLYFALRIPSFVPAVLPIAFLVSILISLGSLHRNNEIIAMRAAGRSLLRMSLPMWGVGLLLSAALFYISADLVPRTVEQSRTFYANLEFAAQEETREVRDIGLIYNLGFDNPKTGRIWFMNRFSERAWLGLGVTVHERSPEGQELLRVSAREAYYDDVDGHWVFIDGRELIFDPVTNDPLRMRSFDRHEFTEFTEDPVLMLTLYKRPKDLSLFELRNVIETVAPEENPNVRAYLVRYHGLLAAPFSCLVIVGIAVPFAVSGVRTNPMIGVAKCIGWFAFFYVLISVANILGARALIDPRLAAWIPNAVMLGLATYFFSRAR